MQKATLGDRHANIDSTNYREHFTVRYVAPPHPLPLESFRIDPQKKQAQWINAGKPRQCVMGLMAG